MEKTGKENSRRDGLRLRAGLPDPYRLTAAYATGEDKGTSGKLSPPHGCDVGRQPRPGLALRARVARFDFFARGAESRNRLGSDAGRRCGRATYRLGGSLGISSDPAFRIFRNSSTSAKRLYGSFSIIASTNKGSQVLDISFMTGVPISW